MLAFTFFWRQFLACPLPQQKKHQGTPGPCQVAARGTATLLLFMGITKTAVSPGRPGRIPHSTVYLEYRLQDTGPSGIPVEEVGTAALPGHLQPLQLPPPPPPPPPPVLGYLGMRPCSLVSRTPLFVLSSCPAIYRCLVPLCVWHPAATSCHADLFVMPLFVLAHAAHYLCLMPSFVLAPCWLLFWHQGRSSHIPTRCAPITVSWFGFVSLV